MSSFFESLTLYIGFAELAIAIGLGFCVIPVVEIVKWIQRIVARKQAKKN